MSIDVNPLLADFRPWLYKEAHYWATRRGRAADTAYIEDLAQEGWVAMWRSGNRYNPNKGIPLRQWVLADARSRIRQCALENRSLGQDGAVARVPAEQVGSYGVNPGAEDTDPDLIAALAGPDSVEYMMIRYHEGDILAAVNGLTADQRRYVYLRFWCAMLPVEIEQATGMRVGAVWNLARASLRDSLGHLSDYRDAGPRRRPAALASAA